MTTVTTILEARLRARDDGLVGQLTATERAATGATTAIGGMAAAGGRVAAATGGAATAQDGLAQATGRAATAQATETAALNAGAAAANRQRDALRGLQSQQEGVQGQFDVGTAAIEAFNGEGVDASKVMELLGGATDDTGSRVGIFAGLLSGGVGLAIGFVTGLLTEFVNTLFETEEAAKAAEMASDGLGQAQSVLGEIFDLTTGKIKAQNDMLLLNARIMAANLRMEAEKARTDSITALSSAKDAEMSGFGQFARLVVSLGKAEKGLPVMQEQRRRLADLAMGVEQGAITAAEAAESAKGIDFDGTGIKESDFLTGLANRVSAGAKKELAEKIDQSLSSGVLASEFRKDGPKGRTRGGGGGGGSNALGNFGESAEEKIRRIADAYNPAPKGLDKAFTDLRTLDGLIVDLGKRQPPSFEKLIGEAKDAREAVIAGLADPLDAIQQRLVPLPQDVVKAKAAVEELDGVIAVLSERKPPNWEELVARAQQLKEVAADTVNGPLNDMLRASREQQAEQLLVLQGREREAAVLSVIHRLSRDMGPLNADQLRQVEQMVAAEERINDLLDKRQDILSIYMASIGDLRGALEDLFGSGNGKDFLKSTEKMVEQFRARMTVESIFGDSLRALEKKMRGQSPLDREIADLAEEVDGLESEAGRSSKALQLFTDAVAEATNSIRRSATPPKHQFAEGSFMKVFGSEGETGDIVVNGSRRPSIGGAMMREQTDFLRELARAQFDPLAKLFDDYLGTDFFRKLSPVFQGAYAGFFTAGPVGGILGAIKELPGLPKAMGDKLGRAMEGAQTGTIVAGLGKALGLKTSTTGGQIGGAIGSALPIPGGDIIGSVIGSFVGGLFKKTKRTAATITGVDSDPTFSGSSKFQKEAGELAGSVQDVLKKVAETLGGTVGSFNVSIGKSGDSWHVDPTGRGRLKKSQGGLDFGQDAEAAVMAAAFDAIGDGGITGLSAAVQQALRSSPDIDRALREALKVQEVEEIIGGMGSALERQFREFEAQAKERVRIATQYGFDVTKIEARNAEDRAKLVEQILSSRVGSLQQLLEDMKFGDLFEGTAAERRDKLLGEIASAKSDAEKGVDGAADRLAELSRKLVETSRDAYGTAGPEYGTDRSNAISAAEKIIAAENERIRVAQQATIDTSKAMQTQNQLTNEANDILAEMRSILRNIEIGGGDYSGTIARGGVARQAQL